MEAKQRYTTGIMEVMEALKHSLGPDALMVTGSEPHQESVIDARLLAAKKHCVNTSQA